MIFTISLLTSCRTVKTTENTQKSKENIEQVKETHQNDDNKTILHLQADSVIIEEEHPYNAMSTSVSTEVRSIPGNIQSSVVKIPHKAGKRTIKIYGLHKNVTSNNQIVYKEKIQVKKKGTIRTAVKTKEEKPSSNGTFIGIVIVLLCLLMIAGFIAWKIAVQ